MTSSSTMNRSATQVSRQSVVAQTRAANATNKPTVKLSYLSQAEKFPRIDPQIVEGVSHFYAASTPLEFRFNEQDYVFQTCFETQNFPCAVGLKVAIADATFVIGIETRLFLDHIGFYQYLHLPHYVRRALLTELLQPLLQGLQPYVGVPVQIVDFYFGWTFSPSPFRLGFELKNTAYVVVSRGFFQLDSAHDFYRFTSLFQQIPNTPTLDPDEYVLAVKMQIGEIKLSGREFKHASKGDMISIEKWYLSGQMLATHLIVSRQGGQGRCLMVGQLDGPQIIVTEVMPDMMQSSDAGSQGWDSEEGSWDDMEVNLTFDLGERLMTIKDLKRIQPGSILNLDQPIEQSTVRILANGSSVGSGQLIAIGEKLGVRVLKLNVR
jgi:type III secretion protein Q